MQRLSEKGISDLVSSVMDHYCLSLMPDCRTVVWAFYKEWEFTQGPWCWICSHYWWAVIGRTLTRAISKGNTSIVICWFFRKPIYQLLIRMMITVRSRSSKTKFIRTWGNSGSVRPLSYTTMPSAPHKSHFLHNKLTYSIPLWFQHTGVAHLRDVSSQNANGSFY